MGACSTAPGNSLMPQGPRFPSKGLGDAVFPFTPCSHSSHGPLRGQPCARTSASARCCIGRRHEPGPRDKSSRSGARGGAAGSGTRVRVHTPAGPCPGLPEHP